MREVTFKVYSVEELNPSALAAAHREWVYKSESPYAYHQENLKTLDAFTRAIGISTRSYSYGGPDSHVWFDVHTRNSRYPTGRRLATWIYNRMKDVLYRPQIYYVKGNYKKQRHSKVFFKRDCNLTGYYLDEEILDPIYDFIDGKVFYETIYELLYDCSKKFLNAVEADIGYCESLEAFIEYSKSYGIEYFESGVVFKQ